MSKFPIRAAAADLGITLNISGIKTTLYNKYGDAANTFAAYNFSGVIIQVQDASEEAVAEGILNKGDVVLFIDESEAFTSKLINGSTFFWDGNNYEIINVIHNDGHYEVYASKTQAAVEWQN